MKGLKIDIVSDVSCPWCIIGYKGLAQALEQLEGTIKADIGWLSFELNPHMPKEGQDVLEHLMEKYNISAEQCEKNKAVIEQRGRDVGYVFGIRGGGRIYNTFDAHRLLYWSKQYGKQTPLKLALFDLYFKLEGDPSSHEQLLKTVAEVGLSKQEAQQVLDSQQFAIEVRKEQQLSQQKGISSVPAVIVNDKYLISGGQPAASYASILTQIAEESV